MHERFPDWYRITTAGLDSALPPDLFQRRWEGVELVCKELADGEEFDLVRLFTRTPPPSVPLLTKFRAAFRKTDAGFPAQGNDLEIGVLAGVAIIHRMSQSPQTAGDRAGLAVLCARGVPETNTPDWARPLIDEINATYTERCKDLRGPASITPVEFNAKAVQVDLDAFTTAFPSGDWTQVQRLGAKGMLSLLTAINNLATVTSAAIDALKLQQQLRQEETDILWWMTAEYSRDLDRRLAEVKLPAAALVAGKELADFVSIPGPLPAKSFLDRVLSTCGTKSAHHKPSELKAAVNALSKEWRTGIAKEAGFARVKDLCPVLGAVGASLATEGADEWVPVYRKAYQREANLQLSGVELAYQVYREWLLVRSATKLDKR
jgi:hypothetical protein